MMMMSLIYVTVVYVFIHGRVLTGYSIKDH